MPERYFTVEEANELLPSIEPLMRQLLERRSNIVENKPLVASMLKLEGRDVGGLEASRMVQDFIAIEQLAVKIRTHGCVIKDLNTGLVDFLSTRDGREVYLCWRFGESRVEYYHELHTGFKGRQHI